MKNSVQIRVNKPCSENFNEFEKTAKGGFCNSCQKEVIDFSQMSNSEVLSFFSLKTKDVCGRFRSSQVQNPISNLLKKGIGIASISLMALAISPPLQAQNTTAKVEVIAQQQYVVKGIVSDDQNYPLPGVNVVLKGSK
ncbi:MAG: hypothetical protein MI810_22795, partial [Flavobacteriales bacterium]|nr:hypothetical protein [Flavobacteriales bacterium]